MGVLEHQYIQILKVCYWTVLEQQICYERHLLVLCHGYDFTILGMEIVLDIIAKFINSMCFY